MIGGGESVAADVTTISCSSQTGVPNAGRPQLTNQTTDYSGRFAILLYGSTVYVLFLVTFCYAIGFVSNVVVPKSIDDGVVGPRVTAILINSLHKVLTVILHPNEPEI